MGGASGRIKGWRAGPLLAVALCLGAGLANPAVARAEGAGRPGGAVTAPVAPEIATLMRTMRIDAVIDILRIEGVDYGQSIEDEMFPGAGGRDWAAQVAAIYDRRAMQDGFARKLGESLAGKPDAIAEATAFFAAPLGQRILTLELEARRALLDDDTEQAAQLAWAGLQAKDGSRARLIERFAAVNDLIESNVMGTLNGNLAFYRGMAGTGLFGTEMTEEQSLSDVWAQEPGIRQQTEDWVYPYLTLAYSGLSDAELQDYVAFSASASGQALNAALFAAFDAVFTPISEALGAAAARQVKGQDI